DAGIVFSGKVSRAGDEPTRAAVWCDHSAPLPPLYSVAPSAEARVASSVLSIVVDDPHAAIFDRSTLGGVPASPATAPAIVADSAVSDNLPSSSARTALSKAFRFSNHGFSRSAGSSGSAILLSPC